jgi:preprotein translocase subunit Sec63
VSYGYVGIASDYRGSDELGVAFGTIRNLLLLAGWTAFFALAYTISQSEGTETKVYDPFEILGLSSVSVGLELFESIKSLSAYKIDRLHLVVE